MAISASELSLTKKIQEELCKYLAKTGREFICENFGHLFEMDVACLSQSGMLHEYEVKISRSDFLADKNKGTKYGELPKFERYQNDQWKCPNYFYYVCPENLITKIEIPHFAGLYYYTEAQGVWMVKNAIRFNHKPQDEALFRKMLRLHTQRKYLGSSLLTYKNKFNKQRELEQLTNSELKITK